MNKRILPISIALLVIASMVMTACGAPQATAPAAATSAPAATLAPAATAAPAEKVTLTIWHNWGPDDAKGAPLQSIFKDFMAANPDIVIKDEVYVDADIPLKVETSSAAKQEPDLVFVQRVGSPFTWTDSGITLPVNDYIKTGVWTNCSKNQLWWNTPRRMGKFRLSPSRDIPGRFGTTQSVFEKAGIPLPTTTDDLISAAKAIRAAGDQPVIASGIDDMGGYLFSLILQSAMSDEEAKQSLGKGDWTVPNAVKGVELFVKLRDAGVFVDGIEGVDFATGNTQFFAGNVGMSHFGAWSFGEAPKELLPKVQLGGFPLPAGSPHQAPVYYSAILRKGSMDHPQWSSQDGRGEEIRPVPVPA